MAACLPSFGLAPSYPYGLVLTKEVDALLAVVLKKRWDYTKGPELLCWNELARCLPHLSWAQAKVLAEAGQQETLSALLLRKAWTPTPAEFFEIAGAMEQNLALLALRVGSR